jgi:hypothetical protein
MDSFSIRFADGALGLSVHCRSELRLLFMPGVKLKLHMNLSPTVKAAQCWPAAEQGVQGPKRAPMATVVFTAKRNSPFELLTARGNRPVRIPTPLMATRPVFRGTRAYLRAMREAEMAIWSASVKFPLLLGIVCAGFVLGGRHGSALM